MNNFKSLQLVCAVGRGRKSLAVGSANSHRCNVAKAVGMFKRLRSLNRSLIWSLGKRNKKPHRFGYRSLANGVFARHSSRTLQIHVKQAISTLLRPLPENDSLSITSLACCNTERTRNTQPPMMSLCRVTLKKANDFNVLSSPATPVTPVTRPF